MKKSLSALLLIASLVSFAQQRPPAPPAAAPSAPAADARPNPANIPFNPDQSVTADHEVTIKGVKVPYKTTTGMMPVWDTEGKVQAGVFYTS